MMRSHCKMGMKVQVKNIKGLCEMVDLYSLHGKTFRVHDILSTKATLEPTDCPARLYRIPYEALEVIPEQSMVLM